MDGGLDVLEDLAPARLERRRETRYRGDELALPLSSFAPDDAATIVELYARLGEIAQLVATEAASLGPEPIVAYLATDTLRELVARVQRLGREAHEPTLAGVIHDLRGGAFNALVLQLSRIGPRSFRRAWVTSIALLTRDHRKMMRGLVEDLDPVARSRDLDAIPHSVGTLVEALRDFPAQSGKTALDVAVSCDFDATVAESCVECGAIDRIAYNLLNNAVRHAVPPKVEVTFMRTGDDLRVVVQNQVSREQRRVLEGALRGQPGALFGTFSTTGSGQGLQIVTTLVGSAYGVPTAAELVAGRYVGAELIGERFVTWFHWPLSGA